MAVLNPPDNTRYVNRPDDIRINVNSGVLNLGDGTGGGIPLSGINYGFISGNIVRTLQERPPHVDGFSLQKLMNEFPAYSTVHWDRTSVGAQLFAPISTEIDDLMMARRDAENMHALRYFPQFDSAVITEYNCNKINNLTNTLQVSGRIGGAEFNVPLTKDPSWFTQTSPTRLEMTTAEISDSDLFATATTTTITSSGIVNLTNTKGVLPLYIRPYFNVSGITTFMTSLVGEEFKKLPQLQIHGLSPYHDLRNPTQEVMEIINIDRNGSFKASNIYSEITKVEALNFQVGSVIKIKTFEFRPKYRLDPYLRWQSPIRSEPDRPMFWHLLSSSDKLSTVVHHAEARESRLVSPTLSGYLVLAYPNRTDILTSDIEFGIDKIFLLKDELGAPVGIYDVCPIPNSRYLLAVASGNTAYVYDTYIPSPDFSTAEFTQPAPIRLTVTAPISNDVTCESYKIRIEPIYTNRAIGIQRWQWSLLHSGVNYILNNDGTTYAFHHLSGWQTNTSGEIKPIELQITNPGSYLIQLDIMDDDGTRARAYAYHEKYIKQAICKLEMSGVSPQAMGVDFDTYERPWFQYTTTNVRGVLRYDIGHWLVSEKVFITREAYDEIVVSGQSDVY